MGRFLLLSTLATWTCGCGALLDFDPPDPQERDGGATDFGSPVIDGGMSDAAPTDGGGIDASPPDGGPPPCRLDSQCDDHVFCDGIEVCVMGRCLSGGPPPCTPVGAPDCVRGGCDAMLDTCVQHADDSICAAGQICDRVEGCRAPPTCGVDGDCAHDACHTATCSGGSCLVVPNPPCVDPNPSDCLVEFCHPALGCTGAPSSALCDDGIACTMNVCGTDGSCAFPPDDSFCDFDGMTCTRDVCDPVSSCSDTSTGCLSTADDTICAAWVGTLSLVDPPPACFSGVCVPGTTATVDPTTGCALAPVCTSPGSTCVASSTTPPDAGAAMVCASVASGTCTAGTSCDDGNPCNGTETCVSMSCRSGPPPCGTALGTICTLGHSGTFACAFPDTTVCFSP